MCLINYVLIDILYYSCLSHVQKRIKTLLAQIVRKEKKTSKWGGHRATARGARKTRGEEILFFLSVPSPIIVNN